MNNDFEMNDFQETIMKERYALPTEKTWADVSKRVANHLSKAEYNGDMSIWEKRFNWVLSNGYLEIETENGIKQSHALGAIKWLS